MVFPVIGGDGKPTGYEIENSLRFNYADSPRLTKSGTVAGSTTFTFSAWLKFTIVNNYNFIFCDGNEVGLAKDRTQSGGQFYLNGATGGTYTNSDGFQRDPSAWYHVVVSCNSGTGIIYVNNDNRKGSINIPQLGNGLSIGSLFPNADYYMDGYMSEVHFVDGTALNPSSFAETDDNGVWIPKDCKDDLTYGTNGFYLEFKQSGTSQNSSGMGADTSGNDNHFAVSNLAATDITTDTPTNNFATMNPVHKSSYGSAALPTFSEGNLKIGMNSDSSTSSTIAPSKGKWYVEYKQGENTADNGGYPIVGISATLGGTAGDVIGFRTPSGSDYRGQLGTTSVSNAFGSARSANDIFGFYINLDDDILIVHKNGSDYMSSGASSGLNWSGGLTTTNPQTGFYHFYVQNNQDGSPAYTDEVNFGNPSFSISSGNADANGFGNFEYSPTLSGVNYYAMCTKNLAEYG